MEEELKMVTQTMEYERLNNGWTLLFNLNKNQQPIKEASKKQNDNEKVPNKPPRRLHREGVHRG